MTNIKNIYNYFSFDMQVMRRCEQVAGVSCITLHPGFEGNCLNPYVLQGVLQTYMQLYGDIPEEIPTRSVIGPKNSIYTDVVLGQVSYVM